MKAALEELGLNNTAELFEQLGLGERLAPLTARLLLGIDEDGTNVTSPASLTIAGTEGMVETREAGVAIGRRMHLIQALRFHTNPLHLKGLEAKIPPRPGPVKILQLAAATGATAVAVATHLASLIELLTTLPTLRLRPVK